MGLRGTTRLAAALVAFSLALFAFLSMLVLGSEPAAGASGAGPGAITANTLAHYEP